MDFSRALLAGFVWLSTPQAGHDPGCEWLTKVYERIDQAKTIAGEVQIETRLGEGVQVGVIGPGSGVSVGPDG